MMALPKSASAISALVFVASLMLFPFEAMSDPIISLVVSATTTNQTVACGAGGQPACPAGGLQVGGSVSSGGPDAASKSESFALASAHSGGPGPGAFYGLFASASTEVGSSGGAGNAVAGASATWLDFITLTAPGIAPGTEGFLSAALLLSGSQTGIVFDIDQGRGNPSSFSSSLVLNLDYGLSHFNVSHNLIQFWNGQLEEQNFGLTIGDFKFKAKVVFGQPNAVRILTSVNAGATADNHGSAFGSADFSSTVSWGGISSLTLIDGTPVTNFTARANSGFDYTATPAPHAVPEPSSAVLLMLGVGVAATFGSRRRRGH